MSAFAKGRKAFGMCDRTGFRYPLNELVPQFENRRPTGLMVGKDVVDIDHEQLQLGKVRSSDPQSLKNPRPDQSQAATRELYAFDPVGGGVTELGSRTVGLDMTALVGRVTVS